MTVEARFIGEDGREYTILEGLVEDAVFNFRSSGFVQDEDGYTYLNTLTISCFKAVSDIKLDERDLFPIIAMQASTEPSLRPTPPGQSQFGSIFSMLCADIIYQEVKKAYPEIEAEENERSFGGSQNSSFHD